MARKEMYVVVYDISNDKRRTKLHNKLLDFGTPVQYSVFECHLDQKMKKKMDEGIKKILRPRKDSLRVYAICANCEVKIEIHEPKKKESENSQNIILE